MPPDLLRFRRVPWAPSARPAAFVAAEGGAAAVEFAFVSLPLIALFGAILQVAYVIWASQNLDRTVQNAARTLFTGQFQIAHSGTTDPATLLTALNATMCGSGATKQVTLFDCSSVKIDVVVATSFGTGASSKPMDNKAWNADFGKSYTCAKPGAIVVVTAAVKIPVFFTVLNLAQKSFADGAHLLQSTVVFRTEPYLVNGTAAC